MSLVWRVTLAIGSHNLRSFSLSHSKHETFGIVYWPVRWVMQFSLAGTKLVRLYQKVFDICKKSFVFCEFRCLKIFKI